MVPVPGEGPLSPPVSGERPEEEKHPILKNFTTFFRTFFFKTKTV